MRIFPILSLVVNRRREELHRVCGGNYNGLYHLLVAFESSRGIALVFGRRNFLLPLHDRLACPGKLLLHLGTALLRSLLHCLHALLRELANALHKRAILHLLHLFRCLLANLDPHSHRHLPTSLSRILSPVSFIEFHPRFMRDVIVLPVVFTNSRGVEEGELGCSPFDVCFRLLPSSVGSNSMMDVGEDSGIVKRADEVFADCEKGMKRKMGGGWRGDILRLREGECRIITNTTLSYYSIPWGCICASAHFITPFHHLQKSI